MRRKPNRKHSGQKPPRESAKQGELSHLWHFESMDRINRAMQGMNDLEQVMKDVLDTLLSVFNCDRAWLVYPCDPESPTWQVPMECTRQEYPGVLPIGVELPLDPVGAEIYRILRDTDGPVKFGIGEAHAVPMEITMAFKVQSFIAMAFYPKIGKPWSFGLHQCSYARVWMPQEERLFQEIGRRLSDTLSALLVYRNLQETEKQIKQLIDVSPIAMVISSGTEEHVEWVNDKFIELFGYTVEDMPDVQHWWPLAYPDEKYRAEIKARWEAKVEQAIREKGQIEPMEATVRCKDGSIRHVEFRLSSIGEKNIVTFVDLTARKRAEAELRQNRETTLQFSEQLAVLQEVTNGLSKAESSDDLCKQAVQLARSRLGFDRVSIWFIEEHLGIMRGSFGTDEHGELRDERNAQVEFRHEGLAWLLFSHKNQMALVAHRPLYDHLGREVGEGDNAMAALWDGDEVIGVISVDNLFTGQTIGEHRLEVLRLFATTLGHLITRKRAEEKLIIREREYRVLVENIPDLIVRYDTNLRRIYVNPAWEKASGLSAKDVVNLPYTNIRGFPNPVNNAYLEKLQKALVTGITETAEFIWMNAKGETLFLEYVIVPEYDTHGKIIGVLSVGRDITERKRMEEALSASEAELRTLMSCMTDIIFVGNSEGRYLKIVDTNSSLVYKPPEELLGKTLHEVFPKDQADFFLNQLRQALDTKKSVNFEYSLMIGGQEVWFYATVSPMTDDKTLMVARDITDRKKAEAQLLASEQLFRALVENSPDFIARYDLAFRRIYVNPAIQKLFGAPVENMLGRTPSEQSPVYAPQVYIDHLQQVIDTARENTVEMPFRTASGEMHWGHMRFVPEFGPNGQVVSVLAIGRDIHEIKENERRFKMLAENFPDLVMRFDRDGRYIYINPAFEKTLGLSVEVVIGKTLRELPQSIKGEENTTPLSWIRRAFDEGVTNETEVRWDTRMGERIFDNRYVPEKDAAGNVATVLCVARDLTENKRAEEALRRSEQKFRALAENIPNVVFQCKNDSRYSFLYLNNAIEDLTGYPKEDFLEKGLSFFDLYHPDDLKTMPTAEENNITDINRNPFHITYRIHHKSGEWRWVDEWGIGIENTEGKVEFLEGIMIDITEHKQAEAALRESEERYRQLVNLSPDTIAVYHQGRVVFVNPATVQMVGAKSAGELIGRPVLDFIHPNVRAVIQKSMDEVEATGLPLPFIEEKFLRLDGSIIDVEVAVVPYTSQGLQYTQIVARNITERKHHEIERETIIAVSTALRQATTSTDILSVILDQLIGLFKADGAVVALPDPQTGGGIDEMGRGPVGERMIGLNIPPGVGIYNWVIANKKTYLNNHVDEDSLFYRPDLLGESRCLASVPLIAQEQLIGVLWIVRQAEIMEQEVRLLNAIADIAANAIHRVMLHEQTVQQLHHLLALHQIDLTISSNFDLNVMLDVILQNVKNELEVDAVSILLMNPVTHTLNYAAGIGFRTLSIERSQVKIGHGYAGRAAQEYRTISGPDLNQSSQTFSRLSLLADEGFSSHYATPLVVKGQVKGVLEIFHRKTFKSDQEWITYFETLATQAAIAIESASLFENLQRSNMELRLAYDATIEGWSRALDLRDKETEGHTQRVTDMVLELAEKMGLSDSEKINLRRGALLHDIGKMGVPDSVLLKPGPLSDSEWEIMKQHPLYAYQMLSPIAYLKHALDIPYCHHEKWDGSGYPRGLKKEEIPLYARLFSIVDVYDALTSDRPYRVAWPQEKVRQYIQEEAGRQFDPKIVKLFFETT